MSDWEDITNKDDWEDVTNSTPPKPSLSASDVITGAIVNTPESALNIGKGIYNTLRHPVDSATGIVKAAAGGVEKLIPESLLPAGRTNEANFDAVAKFFTDRYGGIENLKNTIANDPVGFAADLSTVLGVGGAALKAGGLTKAGNIVSKVGGAVDPVNAAINTGKLVAKGISKIPVTSPERLYASAVKPPKNIKKSPAQLNTELSTGLDEGILPNQSGLEKLNATVKGIEQSVEDAAAKTGGSSYFTSTEDALKYVPDVVNEYAKKSAFPTDSLNILKNATDKFIAEHGDYIDLNHAINIKKGIYEDLRGKYGRQTTAPSEIVDWHKAVARGLKDSTYDAMLQANPELKALGQKEGALLGLKSAIEAGAQRINKRDIMGIGVPIKTGVGAAVGKMIGSESIGAVAGAIAGIMDTPLVKARLSVALNKANKSKLSTNIKYSRLAAYQAGKNQGEE